MHIAILVESLNQKSGSRAPIELAKYLSKKGQTVDLYAFDSEKPVFKSNNSNLKIYVIQRNKNFVTSRILPNSHLIRMLRKTRPQVALIAAFLPATLATRIAGTKIVRVYMGTQFGSLLENINPQDKPSFMIYIASKLVDTFVYLSELISLHLAHHTIAISKFAAREAQNLYKKRVDTVIYLGGDHLLKNNLNKSKLKPPFIFTTVSRITPYKGFHEIINALNDIKDSKKIKLLIVGTFFKKEYIKYLKKMTKKIDFELVLNASDHDLAKIYQKTFVYLSFDKYLFFGLPIVEAAFFKKPSIVANFAAAPEVVNPGQTGLMVHNRKELTLAAKRFINNPTMAQKMGIMAQKNAAEKFTWNIISNQYLTFLEKIAR